MRHGECRVHSQRQASLPSRSGPDAHSARMAEGIPNAHRNEGGLQRRRLRRLHGYCDRPGERQGAVPRRELLHPFRAANRREGRPDHRRGVCARRPPASRAASDDRQPWQPVRILHARFRDVHGRGACERKRPARRRACRQSVPVHRIRPYRPRRRRRCESAESGVGRERFDESVDAQFIDNIRTDVHPCEFGRTG